ncbi:MAG: transposase [Roseinatronobacter sp.]
MAKTTGGALRGQRLVDHAPFGHWRSQTFLLRDIGAWFLFLPPYSPDLDPIEVAFAKLKAPLRKAAARSHDHLWRAVGHVCALFTDKKCRDSFKAAGSRTDAPRRALIWG